MPSLLSLAAQSLTRVIDPRLGLAVNEEAAATIAADYSETLQPRLAREARFLQADQLPPMAWLWLLDALGPAVRELALRTLGELVGLFPDPVLKFRVLRAAADADASGGLLDMVAGWATDAYDEGDEEARLEPGPSPQASHGDAPALTFALLQLDTERVAVHIQKLLSLDRTAGSTRAALSASLEGLEPDQRERWSRLIGDGPREA